MSSKTNTHIPLQLHKLFTKVTEACNEVERRQIVADLKERHQDPIVLKDDDLLGTFSELFLNGKITEDDLGIIFATANKSQNKHQIIFHLEEFRRSQPFRYKNVVRSTEKYEVLRKLSNQVHGIHIHGSRGMGKTTFAKEIVNEFEQPSWEIIRFELREAKDIDTAYLLILFTLDPNEILRSSPGMLENTVAKRKRERNLILTCLRQKCNKQQKILLLFDNIESELIERYKEELFCFFDAIINTEACKIDILKFVLTSRIDFKLPMSIINHCLEPLPSSTSKNFMCRTRKFALQSDEEKALAKITEFCRNIPYLIEGAEHIMRNGCITSKELLQKIETHIDNGVPEQYVTIKTLFESIPTENLRILAVKLCVFPRPFSSSDAKEVAELKSDYDTSLDLEYLRNNQVIRSETVDGETKHEVRTLFKEFTETYLRVEILVYKNSYNEAKVKFGQHFGNKFLNLADTLDKDFVASFEEIQKDKLSFDCMLKLSVHGNEILEHGFHFLHHESICRVAIFLEALMNIEERKTLFRAWADVLEEKGHLLLSAYMRGWESIQLPDTGGTAPPERILHHAEECFDQAVAHKTDVDQFNGVKGFLLYCKGKLNREECVCLTSKKYPQKKNNLLKKALQQCEGALEIYKNLHNGRAHNVTVRILTCMGHCYMDLDCPATAEIYYRQALEMKLKLTEGNERHNEIPTFYNHLSQVYQKLGDYEGTEKTIIDRVFGRLSQDTKTHYERAVSYVKKAIELNKVLDLDDTLSTATLNRNLANMLITLKRYDEALECAEKSYEVRNKLLGQHPETVRILYLMGVINEWRKNHGAALLNYEEAFNMEESLPKENHSVVKDLVCDRLEAMCIICDEKVKLRECKPRIEQLKKRKQFYREEELQRQQRKELHHLQQTNQQPKKSQKQVQEHAQLSQEYQETHWQHQEQHAQLLQESQRQQPDQHEQLQKLQQQQHKQHELLQKLHQLQQSQKQREQLQQTDQQQQKQLQQIEQQQQQLQQIEHRQQQQLQQIEHRQQQQLLQIEQQQQQLQQIEHQQQQQLQQVEHRQQQQLQQIEHRQQQQLQQIEQQQQQLQQIKHQQQQQLQQIEHRQQQQLQQIEQQLQQIEHRQQEQIQQIEQQLHQIEHRQQEQLQQIEQQQLQQIEQQQQQQLQQIEQQQQQIEQQQQQQLQQIEQQQHQQLQQIEQQQQQQLQQIEQQQQQQLQQLEQQQQEQLQQLEQQQQESLEQQQEHHTTFLPASASNPGSGEDAFHVKNGALIVIVMNAFTNDTPGRGGSMQDVQALLNTFVGFLGFKYKQILDTTKQEILDKLKKIARNECHKYDCCVVCIMSHGELDSFYDVNGNKIQENTITSILKKYFYEKPKLLFLQACRTHPDQQTVRTNTRYNEACKSSGPATRAVLRDSEMLIGYSCCEGMKAYRGTVSFSFYLQTLCKVLKEKYSDTDILSILTEVNKRVQEQMTEKTDKVQVCPFTSTLSKKVYFHAPIGK